jgi:hypothetical protein
MVYDDMQQRYDALPAAAAERAGKDISKNEIFCIFVKINFNLHVHKNS